jgi:hypothetical protein
LFRIRREIDYRFWLIPTWLISLQLIAVMLSIARYWAFYGVFSFPYWNWWTRYNFVFACSGLLLWFILLRPQRPWRIPHWTTLVLVALTVGYVSQVDTRLRNANPGHENDGYAVKRYGDRRYWARTDGSLERSIKTGCPHAVKVVGYPRGKWSFVYESSLPVPEDCEVKSGVE